MAKTRETMRIGLPIRATKLRGLIDVAEPTDEATLRYRDGYLFLEEPEATLLDGPGEIDPADGSPA